MLHLVNQKYEIVTPERSVPSSPSLSPAVVTHTTATSIPAQRHSWDPSGASAVDFSELSKLLQQQNPQPPHHHHYSNNNKPRPRSQLFQTSKPPSPTLSTSSAEPTFCLPPAAEQKLPQRPMLSHRPSSTCSTPSQFVFKKPEYDERYNKTHFHRASSQDRKDLFLAWSDLRRFFVSTQQQPSSPNGSVHSQEDVKLERPSHETQTRPKSETFANQFRQDIGGRYGTWGKKKEKMR
jgi:hypothetical protein